MRSSQFTDYLVNQGATLEDDVVLDFGDARSEYEALATDGLAIADRSERETVVATGADVAELIQGLVTNDVFKLAVPGRGQLSTAVNVKGRFVCDLRIVHVLDRLLIDLEPGRIEAGALQHFRRNIINEDAKLVDRSEQIARIALIGPTSRDVLIQMCRDLGRAFALVETWGATWGTLAGADIVAQKLGTFGIEAWEIYVAREDAQTVWETLVEAGPAPVGRTALEWARIEYGHPRFDVELDEKIIPLEADWNDTVAYDKGCYLGQEIIARLDTLGTPAKMLRVLYVEAELAPNVGDAVKVEDKKIGEVRSVVESQRLGHPVALAYLKRKFNDDGTSVVIESGDNALGATAHTLDVHRAEFEKRRAR